MAGGKDQRVVDNGPGEHSVFTGYLLKALEEREADLNRDGYITFQEMSAYLLPAASNTFQTPSSGTLAGHELGEFVFSVGGRKTPSAPTPNPQETVDLRGTSSLSPEPKSTAQNDVMDNISENNSNVYAVIIGISEYEDSRLDLNYAANDAQGVYDLLTDPNYGGIPEDHIELLLNKQATDRNIKKAIGGWLPQQTDERDTVIIYYAGHGAPEDNETYWVTHNADIEDLYTTALSSSDIAELLGRIESKRIVTFLDSCYSEATVFRRERNRTINTEVPWDTFTGTGRVVISASDGKQLLVELDEYKHGLFTYYLIEGLRGHADTNKDDIVELDEIRSYITNNVAHTARRSGATQTPVFVGRMPAGLMLTRRE
jgi:uncharacterized caspase-like protein